MVIATARPAEPASLPVDQIAAAEFASRDDKQDYTRQERDPRLMGGVSSVPVGRRPYLRAKW